jgi:hypothetical protein
MRGATTAITCVFLITSCTPVHEPRLLPPRPAPERRDAPLKVHLHSGELVVLHDWSETDTALVGTGARYTPDRAPQRTGSITLPFDSIALLEVSVRTGSRPSGVTAMIMWSVVWGAFTISCVADPKSCFGSCPTFYVAADGAEVLAAEGFSGSIARVLEARDVDALFPARSSGGSFTLTMRNEALETHAVRRLRLLAAAAPITGRVFAGPNDRFYPAAALHSATRCRAAEGDCLAALAALDSRERTSPADSVDLAAREAIELTFPAARGELGLVLGVRQSLLTTYLFYETMGFLGRHAGTALAALERGGAKAARRAMSMAGLVGIIDVEVWDGMRWQPIGVYDEAGPLATEVHAIPFRHSAAGPVRVRLSAPKGAWRLDWVALAELDDPVTPLALDPVGVASAGAPRHADLARLRDPGRHLATYPGERYEITFQVPPREHGWELFLESEGYYYEWMREAWLAHENLALAALVMHDPAQALRVLAPAFKRAEPHMEREFWSSRIQSAP